MAVSRRNLLVAGGASVAVLGLDVARRVWVELAANVPPANALASRHMAIISALANTILPTTDTPGALDVGVPAWVAYVLTDSLESADRQRMLGGLDALDERARTEFGRGIADLASGQMQSLIDPLDKAGRFQYFSDRVARVLAGRVSANGTLGGLLARLGLERRGFQEIKSLIVHGYFTSELVQRDLMKVQWA